MAKSTGRKTGRPPANDKLQTDLLSVYNRVISPKRFEELTEKLYELAMKGDKDLLKYVQDRALGRPKDSVDLTSGNEKLTMQLYLPEKRARTDK